MQDFYFLVEFVNKCKQGTYISNKRCLEFDTIISTCTNIINANCVCFRRSNIVRNEMSIYRGEWERIINVV